MEKLQVVKEIHKAARKNFPRRHVILRGIDDLWQADLAEFRQYSRDNKGYKYILVVIDCFSKFLFTEPLKSKTGKEVADAMKKVLNHGRIPKNFQTDFGKEFYNRQMKDLMDKHSINHYSSYTVKKASIAERVIRTLKNRLYENFSHRGKYKWVDVLPEITEKYNETVHRTIGIEPSRVTKKNEKNILHSLFDFKISPKVSKLKVGDVVRISKYKNQFAKGYTPNWSTELFTVVKVNLTSPITYILEDMRHERILGSFYKEELQKAKYSDVYLMEKILRRKGNKMYVRWLGLDKSHDQWVDKSQVL